MVITLNDEKTTPTEVEVPVDLSWGNASAGLRCERKHSANKTIVLAATLLVLGLTVVTLFKVQNLVYSTSYMNWRMQELESAVNDGNDDLKLVKYKLSLDESNEARAEALIGSLGKPASSLESQDLKLSESQNQRSKNSLAPEPEAKKESEPAKGVESEKTEAMNNDAREHPNPADPEEWIKPLVEILEDVSNHPLVSQRNDNSFFKNVLELLAPPPKPESALGQDLGDGKIILNSVVRVQARPMMDQQGPPEPFDFLKKMLPTNSNIKIIHFNERPLEQQPAQPSSLEEEMAQRLGLPSVKILSPFDGINKSPVPIKFFGPTADKQEQPIDEVRPKIMIKSVRVKMVPLPFRGGPEDFRKQEPMPMPLGPMGPGMNDKIEVFRMNPESLEPSQEVEAPKLGQEMPFPLPFTFPFNIETILGPNAKNIRIIPMGGAGKPEDPQAQSDEMAEAEKIIPKIHDLIMNLTPPEQNEQNSYNQEPQPQQAQPNVEMTKVPVRPMPLLPQALMESLLPMNGYGADSMAHVAEQDQQQPQQEQPEQPEQPQEQQASPKQSTRLTPVSASWDMQSQNSREYNPEAAPAQN